MGERGDGRRKISDLENQKTSTAYAHTRMHTHTHIRVLRRAVIEESGRGEKKVTFNKILQDPNLI